MRRSRVGSAVGSQMKERLKKVAALLPYLPRSIRLTWEAAGYWSVAWLLLLIVTLYWF